MKYIFILLFAALSAGAILGVSSWSSAAEQGSPAFSSASDAASPYAAVQEGEAGGASPMLAGAAVGVGALSPGVVGRVLPRWRVALLFAAAGVHQILRMLQSSEEVWFSGDALSAHVLEAAGDFGQFQLEKQLLERELALLEGLERGGPEHEKKLLAWLREEDLSGDDEEDRGDLSQLWHLRGFDQYSEYSEYLSDFRDYELMHSNAPSRYRIDYRGLNKHKIKRFTEELSALVAQRYQAVLTGLSSRQQEWGGARLEVESPEGSEYSRRWHDAVARGIVDVKRRLDVLKDKERFVGPLREARKYFAKIHDRQEYARRRGGMLRETATSFDPYEDKNFLHHLKLDFLQLRLITLEHIKDKGALHERIFEEFARDYISEDLKSQIMHVLLDEEERLLGSGGAEDRQVRSDHFYKELSRKEQKHVDILQKQYTQWLAGMGSRQELLADISQGGEEYEEYIALWKQDVAREIEEVKDMIQWELSKRSFTQEF